MARRSSYASGSGAIKITPELITMMQNAASIAAGKQDTLISGTNIKTINSQTVLGSGNITVEGGGGLTLGETSITAYRGDRGKTAYDHSQLTHANPNAVTLTQVKTDVDISDALTSRHLHDNKAALDSIEEALTTPLKGNYDTAYSHSQSAHAPAGAEVNVNADWNASSGDSQILNKPTIPVVSDTAYGSSWNTNMDAPSKNAIYNKIETLGSGSGLSQAQVRQLTRR